MAVTLLAYWPAWPGKFVWDDDAWTTGISGLLRDVSGLRLIWCQPTALQQYYPLTATTFWIDYHFWGFWTLPYHLENILLHAGAGLLFWKLLRRLAVPGAWLAAAIFALHPVMVESAGWITERKNVLSLVFFLGSLLAYGTFASDWRETNDSAAPRRRSAYALAILLFLGALFSKTTTFSLPAVILLICWWKRGCIRWKQDVLPTLPFFGLAIGLGLTTFWLEKNHVGARGSDFALTFAERGLIAGRAFWFYIGQLVWPAKLCFVYPRWQPNPGSGWQWLFPLTAIGALFTLWQFRRRIGRGPVSAGFFYAGTLFPVLGFMNVYGMRYAFVWDHWVYLPSLGLVALAAALVARGAGHFRQPALAGSLAVVVLPVLAGLTWRQCGMYANLETLWQTTLARNPGSFLAQNNLGFCLFKDGSLDEALARYNRSLQIKPDYEVAHNNLGTALLQKGQVDKAIAHFQQAMQIEPNYSDPYMNLGNALVQKGDVDGAIVNYQKSLQIKSDQPEAYYNFGNALLKKGDVDKAIILYQTALHYRPDYAEARNNLGNAYFMQGRMDEAIAEYQLAVAISPDNEFAFNGLGNAYLKKGLLDEAIANFQKAGQIKPEYVEIQNNLGTALLQRGRVAEAMVHYQKALQIKPDPEIQNTLAWILATAPQRSLRNGNQAVELALQANDLTGGANPVPLHTLAAAYAEAGRFGDAVQTAQKALALAQAAGRPGLVEQINAELKLYLAGLPFHQEGKGPANGSAPQ